MGEREGGREGGREKRERHFTKQDTSYYEDTLTLRHYPPVSKVRECGVGGGRSGGRDTYSLAVVLVVALHLLPQTTTHLRHWPHAMLTLHGIETQT